MKYECDRCRKDTFDPNILGYNVYCNNCYQRFQKIIRIFDTEITENREQVIKTNKTEIVELV